MSPSAAGLAISSALMLTGSFQWGVRQSTEVENQMTSVERVIEYSKLPPEAALESPPGVWKIRFLTLVEKLNEIYFHRQAASENMATVRQNHL
jgi:hypothetical protein